MNRESRNEDGAALILALAFMALFGVLISIILGFASTSALATQRFREQRARIYAADGAMDAAIHFVRIDSSRGAYGSPCPSFSATVDGVTATVTCTNVGEPDHADRSVRFVAAIEGEDLITASVIYRDTTSQTTEPQVDVLDWTYHS